MAAARLAVACSLVLALAACERKQAPSAPTGPDTTPSTPSAPGTPADPGPSALDIAPASGPIEASEQAALARLAELASASRSQWSGRTFEEFERSVYREPFEGGKYILSGDIAVSDRKHLREIFETRIEPAQQQTVGGKLILSTLGGQDNVWSVAQRGALKYCVSREFGDRHATVVAALDAAAGAWESSTAIDFVHVPAEDGNCTATNANVVFDVRPVDVNGEYLARAFFPNEPRAQRNLLVDQTSFELDPAGKLQLVGILRHELGHTLGFRHEHTRPESGTCFEDSEWRPIGSGAYDRFSVMHYPQCNGGGDWSLDLTATDRSGAACVYGAAPTFTIDPAICPVPTVVPAAPSAQPQAQPTRLVAQAVAAGARREYGPYVAVPGSQVVVRMSGRDAAGDPDLYVRLGSKPELTNGRFNCRPYRSGADEECILDARAPERNKVHVMVHGYAAGNYDLEVTFVPQP